MLNFINKEGKKVMEIHDNGETVVLVEDLKKSLQASVENKTEENRK